MTPDFAQLARQQWEARRHRNAVLGSAYGKEGAWDILLYLRACAGQGCSVPIEAACSASGLALTTSFHAIERLIRDGLAVRKPDPADRRRRWLELTPLGFAKVDQALSPTVRRSGGRLHVSHDGTLLMSFGAPDNASLQATAS